MIKAFAMPFPGHPVIICNHAALNNNYSSVLDVMQLEKAPSRQTIM